MASEIRKPSQVDHLHGVIERCAGNSFTIKGWAITVASGFFGFAFKDAKPAIDMIGVVPVAIFWMMDSYYLAQERHFPKLYNAAMIQDQPPVQIVGLTMAAADWRRALAAPVVAGLYVTLALCCVLIGIGLFAVA